jgi:hypothetical protein
MNRKYVDMLRVNRFTDIVIANKLIYLEAI